MTNKKQFRISVLCEDKAHLHFVQGYLVALGFSEHKITGKIAPQGRGSGEQYVRDNFARFVSEFRRVKQQNIILVVVTDADGYSYDARFNSLINALKDNAALSENEKIFIIIPARNIESWFCYADNPSICEEDENYKANYKNAPASKYGKKYAADICNAFTSNTFLSLQHAHAEVNRLKSLLNS